MRCHVPLNVRPLDLPAFPPNGSDTAVMRMFRRYLLVVSLLSLALVAGCERGGSPPAPAASSVAEAPQPPAAAAQAAVSLQDVVETTPDYIVGISFPQSAAKYPGLYFSHPGSQYFVVGRVTEEQVADYARRKGVDKPQAERWLAANLDYDPE